MSDAVMCGWKGCIRERNNIVRHWLVPVYGTSLYVDSSSFCTACSMRGLPPSYRQEQYMEARRGVASRTNHYRCASHIYQKAVKSHVLVIQLFCQPLTILTTVHVTMVISPSSRLVLLPARQEYLVPVTVFPLSPLPTEQVGIQELSSLQSPRL